MNMSIKMCAPCADFSSLSGIELNEERAIDGDSDFTIRGRLISLVEKVAYLKKRMANLPKEKADKKPSKSPVAADSCTLQNSGRESMDSHTNNKRSRITVF